MATKIMDLPNREPSSLRAPRAALAELATAIPEPRPEIPVYKSGADVAETGSETVSSCGVGSLYSGGAGEHYDRGYKDHAEKHEAVRGEGFFVAITVLLSRGRKFRKVR